MYDIKPKSPEEIVSGSDSEDDVMKPEPPARRDSIWDADTEEEKH